MDTDTVRQQEITCKHLEVKENGTSESLSKAEEQKAPENQSNENKLNAAIEVCESQKSLSPDPCSEGADVLKEKPKHKDERISQGKSSYSQQQVHTDTIKSYLMETTTPTVQTPFDSTASTLASQTKKVNTEVAAPVKVGLGGEIKLFDQQSLSNKQLKTKLCAINIQYVNKASLNATTKTVDDRTQDLQKGFSILPKSSLPTTSSGLNNVVPTNGVPLQLAAGTVPSRPAVQGNGPGTLLSQTIPQFQARIPLATYSNIVKSLPPGSVPVFRFSTQSQINNLRGVQMANVKTNTQVTPSNSKSNIEQGPPFNRGIPLTNRSSVTSIVNANMINQTPLCEGNTGKPIITVKMPPSLKPTHTNTHEVKDEKDSDERNRHGQIKRPMNAFMIWSRGFRSKLSNAHPKASNADVSIKLGEIWHQMSEDKKKPFYEEACRLKQLHKEKHPDWIYRPQPRGNNRRESFPWRRVVSPYHAIPPSTNPGAMQHPAVTSAGVTIISRTKSAICNSEMPQMNSTNFQPIHTLVHESRPVATRGAPIQGTILVPNVPTTSAMQTEVLNPNLTRSIMLSNSPLKNINECQPIASATTKPNSQSPLFRENCRNGAKETAAPRVCKRSVYDGDKALRERGFPMFEGAVTQEMTAARILHSLNTQDKPNCEPTVGIEPTGTPSGQPEVFSVEYGSPVINPVRYTYVKSITPVGVQPIQECHDRAPMKSHTKFIPMAKPWQFTSPVNVPLQKVMSTSHSTPVNVICHQEKSEKGLGSCPTHLRPCLSTPTIPQHSPQRVDLPKAADALDNVVLPGNSREPLHNQTTMLKNPLLVPSHRVLENSSVNHGRAHLVAEPTESKIPIIEQQAQSLLSNQEIHRRVFINKLESKAEEHRPQRYVEQNQQASKQQNRGHLEDTSINSMTDSEVTKEKKHESSSITVTSTGANIARHAVPTRAPPSSTSILGDHSDTNFSNERSHWWRLPFSPYPLEEFYQQKAEIANYNGEQFVGHVPARVTATHDDSSDEEILFFGDQMKWPSYVDPYNPYYFTNYQNFSEPQHNVPPLDMQGWIHYMNSGASVGPEESSMGPPPSLVSEPSQVITSAGSVQHTSKDNIQHAIHQNAPGLGEGSISSFETYTADPLSQKNLPPRKRTRLQ